jgi:hypothetical protein
MKKILTYLLILTFVITISVIGLGKQTKTEFSNFKSTEKVLAISIDEANWTKIFRTINTLLDYGVVVLWSKEEVVVSDTTFPPGTFLFPMDEIFSALSGEESLEAVVPLSRQEIEDYLKSEGVIPFKGEVKNPVGVYLLIPSKVALYEDSGCYDHSIVLALSGFDVDWVSGRDIAAGILDKYDILMSGGGGGARKANISRENFLLAGLGIEGAKKVSEFVKSGGAYLGCCGGSYIGSVVRERFMNWWHPAKRYMNIMNVEDWHISEFSDSGFKSPGHGIYTARNVSPHNPVMFGLPETFDCVHMNGPIWNLIEAAAEGASSPIPLASFDKVSPENFTPAEFFSRSEDASFETVKETGVYKACKQQKTAIAQGFFGIGLVVLSGSHPEMPPFVGLEINRDKLWPSARILSNTVFWSTSKYGKRRKTSQEMSFSSLLIPIAPQKDIITSMIKDCENVSNILKTIALSPLPSWLRPELYRRGYGLSPKAMYEKSLDMIPLLCKELISQIETMDKLTMEVLKARSEIENKIFNETHNERIKKMRYFLRTKAAGTVFNYYKLLDYQRTPLHIGDEDQGFQGVYYLLKIANSKCKAARDRALDLESLEKSTLSLREIRNNPYSNINAATSRLREALNLLCVNESAMEKFLSLWRLFQKASES